LELLACRVLRARMVSWGFPRCARVVSSGSVLRPGCAGSRARPDSRGFVVEAHSDFHGFGVERRSGFHGGRSNFSLNRTPGRHRGVNHILPARRRSAQLLAGLKSWAVEMGGGGAASDSALQCSGHFAVGAHRTSRAAQVGGRAPGSAASVSLLACVRWPFQSTHRSSGLAVGARGGWRLAGQWGFGEFALVGRFASDASGPCPSVRLGLVSFGRGAQRGRRAPDFTASVLKGVLGFMGAV